MTLQDTFEAREFGPPSDDKWEKEDDFSPVVGQPSQVSFDLQRPVVVAEARLEVEQIYINIQHQADADLL